MKELLFSLLVKLRLLALWRFMRRKHITILMLHGVEADTVDSSWQPLWERPKIGQLARTLRELCNSYTPISLDEAVQILEGKAPPVTHGLVVTFDDGYRNNFDVALPLLAELGMPATFFVATGFVESGLTYWVDRLDYALQQAPDEERLLTAGEFSFDLRGLDREALARAYREFRVELKNKVDDDAEMLRLVSEIATDLEAKAGRSLHDSIDADPYASVATWDEQRQALARGATIGSHSVDHFRLTAIARDDVDRQLVESRERIEEELEVDCAFFCYPNGSVDEFIRDRTERAGYRAAVSTQHGLNKIGDDIYTLKRYPVPQTRDAQKDLFRLSGFFESGIARLLLGKG